jgi:hypothetical protein
MTIHSFAFLRFEWVRDVTDNATKLWTAVINQTDDSGFREMQSYNTNPEEKRWSPFRQKQQNGVKVRYCKIGVKN